MSRITASPNAIVRPDHQTSIIRPVLSSALLFMLIAGIAYPLATTAVAQLLMSDRANGSLVIRHDLAIGSEVIGQQFTLPEYFHGRPSATVGTDPSDSSKTIDQPYNAASSGASNQGALSKKLLDAVAGRAATYREENGLASTALIPVDAVTASASGLDPDISLFNARIQAKRIATARGVSIDRVLALVSEIANRPQLGLLGDSRVNVLTLNLTLDQVLPSPSSAR
ncbi:potassium-transporting ATPase subunit KdpC [Pseudomonas sp. NY15435]|uniref:potassium-transporting ATPase subunit KdpC n=1 Tax=Pseudomonas sp. NY15435 TaxID=3400358 RepID=UPI003A8C68D8